MLSWVPVVPGCFSFLRVLLVVLVLDGKLRLEEGLDVGEEGVSLPVCQGLQVPGERRQHLERGREGRETESEKEM